MTCSLLVVTDSANKPTIARRRLKICIFVCTVSQSIQSVLKDFPSRRFYYWVTLFVLSVFLPIWRGDLKGEGLLWSVMRMKSTLYTNRRPHTKHPKNNSSQHFNPLFGNSFLNMTTHYVSKSFFSYPLQSIWCFFLLVLIYFMLN